MSGIERVVAALLLAVAVAGAVAFPRLLGSPAPGTQQLGLIPHGSPFTVITAAPLPGARSTGGITLAAQPIVFSPRAVLGRAVVLKPQRNRPAARTHKTAPVAATPSRPATTPAPAPATPAPSTPAPVAAPTPTPTPTPAPAPTLTPAPSHQSGGGSHGVAVTPTPVPPQPVLTPTPAPSGSPGEHDSGPVRVPDSTQLTLTAAPPDSGQSGPVVQPPAPVVPPISTQSPDLGHESTRQDSHNDSHGCGDH